MDGWMDIQTTGSIISSVKSLLEFFFRKKSSFFFLSQQSRQSSFHPLIRPFIHYFIHSFIASLLTEYSEDFQWWNDGFFFLHLLWKQQMPELLSFVQAPLPVQVGSSTHPSVHPFIHSLIDSPENWQTKEKKTKEKRKCLQFNNSRRSTAGRCSLGKSPSSPITREFPSQPSIHPSIHILWWRKNAMILLSQWFHF